MKFFKVITHCNSVILLLCFFLPFIIPMCSEKKSESNSTDSIGATIDTSKVMDSDTTTIKTDSISSAIDSSKKEVSVVNDSTSKSGTNEAKKESQIIKFIMMPDGENHSGIGFMYYYTIWGLSIITLPASFVLIIIALLMKRWKVKTILITIGYLCFVGFGLLNFEDILFGYWTALFFFTLAVVLHWATLITTKEH